jgi:DinB superfamily
MERFVDEDLTEAEFRECVLDRARLIGVVMQGAEIDGLVTDLVVNGVEVTSYVEAELDRRHPVRVLIRSGDPSDLREAWRQLRADWAATVARMRAKPGIEHRSVNDEWSAVQTLRHLVFVHDSWFRRCCLGSTALFTPIGLGPAFLPEEQGPQASADPTLDEVLTVRDEQAADMEAWLATVTADQLQQPAPIPDNGMWPPYATGRSVLQCLATVLDEEWAHHGFCVRDLGLIEASGAG